MLPTDLKKVIKLYFSMTFFADDKNIYYFDGKKIKIYCKLPPREILLQLIEYKKRLFATFKFARQAVFICQKWHYFINSEELKFPLTILEKSQRIECIFKGLSYRTDLNDIVCESEKSWTHLKRFDGNNGGFIVKNSFLFIFLLLYD